MMTTTELRDLIKNSFNINDLKSLCNDLGLDFEDLGESTREGAARELIGYFQRRGQLQKLIDGLYARRPDLRPDGSHGSGKMKILFFASDPTDQARLQVGKEYREIGEELQKAKQRDLFVLSNPGLSVRARDLSGAMLNEQPQIVHFSGHGSSEGELILENESGGSSPASAAALAELFGLFKDVVKCVVLNACYSKTQAKAIAQHIPYVIGMKQEIGDTAAIHFAIGFYQALGAGKEIEQAFLFGKSQIGMAGIQDESKTPLLHKKSNFGDTVDTP